MTVTRSKGLTICKLEVIFLVVRNNPVSIFLAFIKNTPAEAGV